MGEPILKAADVPTTLQPTQVSTAAVPAVLLWIQAASCVLQLGPCLLERALLHLTE